MFRYKLYNKYCICVSLKPGRSRVTPLVSTICVHFFTTNTRHLLYRKHRVKMNNKQVQCLQTSRGVRGAISTVAFLHTFRFIVFFIVYDSLRECGRLHTSYITYNVSSVAVLAYNFHLLFPTVTPISKPPSVPVCSHHLSEVI